MRIPEQFAAALVALGVRWRLLGLCLLLLRWELPAEEWTPVDDQRFAAESEVRVALHGPIAWHRQTLVKGYFDCGVRSPVWDNQASNALTKFALVRAGTLSDKSIRATVITNLTTEALQSGCEDPLIRYVHWQRHGPPLSSTTNAVQIARDLAATRYHPVLKSRACLDSFNAIYAWGTNRVPPAANELRNLAMQHFVEALKDDDLPEAEIFSLGNDLVPLMWNTNLTARLWPPIEKALIPRHGTVPAAQYLIGRMYSDWAWQARGSGYADTVTDEGWKLFAERLERAEVALRAAWSLSQKMPQIADAMIWVCIGRSYPRVEMERWFRRGQELAPGYNQLYESKAEYLMPKWHGSEAQVLEFGRECVVSTNVAGKPRLLLVSIHESLERAGRKSRQVDRSYFARASVWSDLKSAFEAYADGAPTVGTWNKSFAKYAWYAQDWETLNRQLPKIRKPDPAFFGGTEQFNRMLTEAKAHAKP